MPRVFMLSHLPLFSQGVETLLCREAEVDIVGRESDVENALVEVKRLRPDVVILDIAVQPDEVASIAARILTVQRTALVIAMSPEENSVTLFRQEQRTVHEIKDLMQAIRNGLFHSDSSSAKTSGA